MPEKWIYLYFTFFGFVIAFSLTESRYSTAKTRWIEGGAIVFFVLLESILYPFLDPARFRQLYFFTAHLPCFLLVWLLSKKRDARILFILLTAIMYSSLTLHITSVVTLSANNSAAVMALTLVCITAAIGCFTAFYFRPIFFQVIDHLKNIWWLLIALLAAYFIINMFLIPVFIGEDKLINLTKIFMTLVIIVVFVLICVMFAIQQKKNQIQQDADLLNAQYSALHTKITAAREAEEKIRIERHDMRHKLKTIAALLCEGKTEEAMTYLTAAEHRLDEIQPQQYCTNIILDAVLAYYCAQANASGIAIDTHVALSNHLPVDSGALSIAVANALENAIHAAAKCPKGTGKIWVKGIMHPTLMIEIANTYHTQPSFDKNGLPVTDRQGHGLGIRSIAAFCKQSNAACQFSAAQGIFKLHIYF